jgi:hypothetical protein
MIAPDRAEPAVLAVLSKPDLYIADQAWLADGMVHALGQWQHREGANGGRRRRYGERRVRSWPTRIVCIEWADALMAVAA